MRQILDLFGINLSRDDWRFGKTKAGVLRSEIRKLRPVDFGFKLQRIGGDSDGSYLVPDDLEGIDYCFSPGYGDVSTFEREIFEKYGIKSFVIDPSTPESSNLPYIEFSKDSLGYFSQEKFLGLDEWINSLNLNIGFDNTILQMDIEGSEWDILFSISEELLSRFRIVVLELHQIELWKNRLMFEKFYTKCLHKLHRSFDVLHVHPNNSKKEFSFGGKSFPCIIEVTFHNKRRRKKEYSAWSQVPHPLDKPSRPDLSDLRIDWSSF